MIQGRGLLAKALNGTDSQKYMFYVNGISNSVMEAIPENNYESQEIKKLAWEIENKTFVYFSTIQVNSEQNYSRPYVAHKYKMECLIKDLFPDYAIVRVSNLVGHNPWNENTLFNYLYNALRAGTEVHVIENVLRNVLDVEDFVTLCNCYLANFHTHSTTINIVNPVNYTMQEILSTFEKIFQKMFNKINGDINVAIFKSPCEFSSSLVNLCNINLEDYLPKMIKKYYPLFTSY